jgi:hypothetical protein
LLANAKFAAVKNGAPSSEQAQLRGSGAGGRAGGGAARAVDMSAAGSAETLGAGSKRKAVQAVSPASSFVPRPAVYNVDKSPFVAGLRRRYQEEFLATVTEAMRVHHDQVTRLDTVWPSPSTAGSSSAVPITIGDDLMG